MATGNSINYIPAGTAANVDLTAPGQDALNFIMASAEIVLASGDQTDATFRLQDSNDGTNYNDISGASVTLSSNGVFKIKVNPIPSRYIRGVYTHGTNTTGTIVSTIVLK